MENSDQIPSFCSQEFDLFGNFDVDASSLKILMEYLLKLPMETVKQGYKSLVHALVDGQMRALVHDSKLLTVTVAEQLLISVISKLYPDLFYELSDQIFETYKALITNSACALSLMWVCSQQHLTIKKARIHNPMGMEYWFKHFFPIMMNTKHQNRETILLNHNIMLFAEELLQSLDKLIAQQAECSKYPRIGIASFCSLMNLVFLQKGPKTKVTVRLERIYRLSKNLVFSNQFANIKGDNSSVIFATLVGPLCGRACSEIIMETLSILTLLICNNDRNGDSFLNTWIAQYEDYVPESLILLRHLKEARYSKTRIYYGGALVSKKLKTCGLFEALSKLQTVNKGLWNEASKRGDSCEEFKMMDVLIKEVRQQVKPPRSLIMNLARYGLLLSLIMLFSFVFYSVVYVMCDPDTKYQCILPFDPQEKIDIASSFLVEQYELQKPKLEHITAVVSTNLLLLKKRAGTFIIDQLQFLNEQKQFKTFVVKFEKISNPVSQKILDLIEQIPFDTIQSNWLKFKALSIAQYSLFAKLWRAQAVIFVEDHFPRMKQQYAIFTKWCIDVGIPYIRTHSIHLAKNVRFYARKGFMNLKSLSFKALSWINNQPLVIQLQKNPFVIQLQNSEAFKTASSMAYVLNSGLNEISNSFASYIDQAWTFFETPFDSNVYNAWAVNTWHEVFDRIQVFKDHFTKLFSKDKI